MKSRNCKFISKLRKMVDNNDGIKWNADGDMLEIFDE